MAASSNWNSIPDAGHDTSTTCGSAAPALAIDGPFELVARPASELLLQANAQLAACWGSENPEILFGWSLVSVEDSASRQPVPADSPELPPLLQLLAGAIKQGLLQARNNAQADES